MVCQLAQGHKANLLNWNSTADQRPILLLEKCTWTPIQSQHTRWNCTEQLPLHTLFGNLYFDLRDFPVAQMELPAMQETRVRSLDQEDLLDKEMAILSSILTCKIPWT